MKFREKKKNRTGLYMGIFIIVIMVASTFAIIFSAPPSANTLEYGDYTFKINQNDIHRYSLKLDGMTYQLFYLPDELGDITLNESAAQLLRSAQYVIISVDPGNGTTDDKIILDVARLDLAQYLQKPLAMGKVSGDYALPELGCANATAAGPAILLQVTNSSASIEQRGDCVIVKGQSQGLLRSMTRLLYAYLGVLP